MSLGLIIVLIVILAYASNWLNWRFLNYRPTRWLYYVGALVHESSHALLCIVTGARIREFSVFSDQPHITHEKSKLPLIGNALISSAPIFGGLTFLFLIDRYALGNQFSGLSFNDLLSQIDLSHWQSWVMIFLFLNIGAMLGPSLQDLKNMWFALIVSFFVSSSALEKIGMTAIELICIGIGIQLAAIVCVQMIKLCRRLFISRAGNRSLS